MARDAGIEDQLFWPGQARALLSDTHRQVSLALRRREESTLIVLDLCGADDQPKSRRQSGPPCSLPTLEIALEQQFQTTHEILRYFKMWGFFAVSSASKTTRHPLHDTGYSFRIFRSLVVFYLDQFWTMFCNKDPPRNPFQRRNIQRNGRTIPGFKVPRLLLRSA